MKKKIITIIAVIVLGMIIFLSFPYLLDQDPKNKLKKIGYTTEEQNAISKLSKKTQNYLEHKPYQDNLLEFITNKDFKEEYLEKYLEWVIPNMKSEDIIYIVNNNYIHDNYDNNTLSLMKQEYYIDNNLDRYLAYQTENQTATGEDVIAYINSNVDLGFYENTESTDLSKGILMIANKHYTLGEYVPENLVSIDSNYGKTGYLVKEVYEALKKMFDDANAQGFSLKINSPYRSYTTQVTLYNNYVAKDGIKLADTYSARAGFSEHQTGLAADITSKNTNFDSFDTSNEFKWLQEHAHEYGFILRYPKGKEHLTGYMYESWHYRYIGIEAATYIKDHNITFEEYYAYFVK